MSNEDQCNVWSCEFCGQCVVLSAGSARPKLSLGFYENCKLRRRLIGNECIARRDPERARRLIAKMWYVEKYDQDGTESKISRIAP